MRVLTRARQRTADLGAQSVIEGDALDLASCIEAVLRPRVFLDT